MSINTASTLNQPKDYRICTKMLEALNASQLIPEYTFCFYALDFYENGWIPLVVMSSSPDENLDSIYLDSYNEKEYKLNKGEYIVHIKDSDIDELETDYEDDFILDLRLLLDELILQYKGLIEPFADTDSKYTEEIERIRNNILDEVLGEVSGEE